MCITTRIHYILTNSMIKAREAKFHDGTSFEACTAFSTLFLLSCSSCYRKRVWTLLLEYHDLPTSQEHINIQLFLIFDNHFNGICSFTSPTVKCGFVLSQLSEGIEKRSMPSFLNSTAVKMLMLCVPQRATVQQRVTINLEILFVFIKNI